MDFYSIFAREFRKKVLLIVALMVVLSAGIGLEKGYFTKQVVQTTTFETEKVVKMQYNTPNSSGSEFDYNAFFCTYGEMARFLQEHENQFDFTKFNANWSHYELQDKIEWMQKHIFVNNIKGGAIQFEFMLKPEDPKDLSYTKQMGEKFLDSYILYGQRRLQAILPVSNFEEINHFTLYPEAKTKSRKISVLKFGVVGAVLGLLMGMVIVLAFAMREYRNGRT